MAVRKWTELFKSIRSDIILFNKMEAPGESRIPIAPPMPNWIDDANKINLFIKKTHIEIEELVDLMNTLPTFDGNSLRRVQIENKSSELLMEMQKCNTAIKTLGSKVLLPPEEEAMKKNVKSNLSTLLQSEISRFRNIQDSYEKEIKPPYPEDTTEDPLEDLSEPIGSMGLTTSDIDYQLALDRNKRLKEVSKTMSELKSMFLELSEMIIEQGTVLDRIDKNLILANEQMDIAVVTLTETKKSNSTTTKCWIALLVLVVVFCVVIVVVIRVRRG
uniref:t-SNARE coiled-coil homology domain-containing protein n=1 Tax=Arcella intermedia TaxID=1963864 RepID=A0A6B2LDM9_9EUKA|eukprot:TRINITY_DN21726_c0_g1_i1.p1 TRINITY_DN21726_c0_g1~~TRINITY_DN21726_c0_g1_i1.p1  ORF type:complete len:274 (-),score=54.64 TRINITY_DN21726_c0_g1_i1:111-932(-)